MLRVYGKTGLLIRSYDLNKDAVLQKGFQCHEVPFLLLFGNGVDQAFLLDDACQFGHVQDMTHAVGKVDARGLLHLPQRF